MTTKPNVLLGKDLHLQARPDYCHSWGTEDTGDVDQPSLSRRLLLGLSSRWLFSDSSVRFSTPLSSWGLARQLRHEFSHVGGRAAATYSRLSHRIPVAFIPYSTGSEGGISCKQWSFIVSIHNIKKQVLDYCTQGSLPLEMWYP
jgi:hypothetical protein